MEHTNGAGEEAGSATCLVDTSHYFLEGKHLDAFGHQILEYHTESVVCMYQVKAWGDGFRRWAGGHVHGIMAAALTGGP